jgi:hypothetical protein
LPALASSTGGKTEDWYLIASSKERPAIQKYRQAFLQSLASFGYVEGQNVVIESRFAELDFGRLPSLAAELVELKVDVIVAAPTPAAMAAKKVTSSVPIVMINAGDPVARGLVSSFARPGGNVTGSSFSVGLEHFSKAMELLKEAVPSLRKVGIVVNPANPSHADIADQIASTIAVSPKPRLRRGIAGGSSSRPARKASRSPRRQSDAPSSTPERAEAMSDPEAPRIRPCAADYIPKNAADARAYTEFVMENFEPWDWPWDRMRRRRKRRRGLSPARAIRQARKAGVDVVVAPDGTITFRFGKHEQTATTTGNELDEWMAKHAH